MLITVIFVYYFKDIILYYYLYYFNVLNVDVKIDRIVF